MEPARPRGATDPGRARVESEDSAAKGRARASTYISPELAQKMEEASAGETKLTPVETFKAWLLERHPSLLHAWRKIFDLDGTTRCGHKKFFNGVAMLGYTDAAVGDEPGVLPNTLWGELMPDAAMPDLSEGEVEEMEVRKFDGPAGRPFVKFVVRAQREFGGMLQELFDELAEGSTSESLSPEQFVDGCNRLGWLEGDDGEPSSPLRADRLAMYAEDPCGPPVMTPEDAAVLFTGLDVDWKGHLLPTDFYFLEEDLEERAALHSEYESRKREAVIELQKNMTRDALNALKKLNLPPGHRLSVRPWNVDMYNLPPEEIHARRTRVLEKERASEQHAVHVFETHMKLRFGSLVRGWRRALDPRMTYQVTKKAMLRYCRSVELDHEIDLKALWRTFDRDDDGFLVLEELAPQVADVLARFRTWAHRVYGSSVRAYEWFDTHGLKKLSHKLFTEACLRNGYSFHVDALFSALDLHMAGFIGRPDFEFLDNWEPPEWLTAEPNEEEVGKLRDGLDRRYGNFIKAWRKLLDTNGTNKVSFGQFIQALRQLGFAQDVAAGVFRALDADLKGFVNLQSLDPTSYEVLVRFKDWADRTFGSVVDACKRLDQDGSGELTFSEFRKALTKWSLDLNGKGRLRYLFDSLDLEMRGKVSVADVRFLDDWQTDHDKVQLEKKASKKLVVQKPDIFPRLYMAQCECEEETRSRILGRAYSSPPVPPTRFRPCRSAYRIWAESMGPKGQVGSDKRPKSWGSQLGPLEVPRECGTPWRSRSAAGRSLRATDPLGLSGISELSTRPQTALSGIDSPLRSWVKL